MICVWSSRRHCHPTISCFIKIQIRLTFLVPPACPGCPAKEAVKPLSLCLVIVKDRSDRYSASKTFRGRVLPQTICDSLQGTSHGVDATGLSRPKYETIAALPSQFKRFRTGQVRKQNRPECEPMPDVMTAQPNVGGALCESSVTPFFVPRRKLWLTPAASKISPGAMYI